MKTRRDFLKLTGGYAGLAGLSSMGVPLSLFADDGASLTGYKALVVVLQHGGNDSINMLVPSGTDATKGHALYASIRTTLAVANNDLTAGLTKTDGKLSLTTNPYEKNGDITQAYVKGFYKHANIDGLATNAIMPEFAHLVNEGKVAMVANTGNLISPATKVELEAKTAQRPPYLFSHSNQRKLLFNGVASTLNRNGWAGLIADEWSGINGNSVYGLNLGISRASHLLYGANSEPLIINASGPTSYKSINRPLYDNWLGLGESERFKGLYAKLRKHSLTVQDTLVGDWDNNAPTFSSTNAYGEELFSLPSDATLSIASNGKVGDSLLKQLKAVAKLAKIGKDSGLKRQIFYVQQGGYDTHANQAENHSSRLRELSMGLGDLQLALAEMGMEDEVTTFNLSDFGRSIGNNGDGTDHAWGAHHFVLGGAVTGGLYGTLPDLTLGGDDDISKKGRLIPSTSMSQYLGTIVKWFGADEAMLNGLFPERGNFSQKDLGFMA
jgi:uncharacterized protein (DUF1501 family)